MEALKRIDHGTYNAWVWIHANRDQFVKPVLGPVCLEVSVNGAVSQSYVESLLLRQHKLSFVTQTPQDYERLKQMASAESVLKRITICLDAGTHDGSVGGRRDQVSAAKLREYGISNTLISRVHAAPAVKGWLCSQFNFDRIVVGSTETTWQKRELLTADPLLHVIDVNPPLCFPHLLTYPPTYCVTKQEVIEGC